MSANDRFHEVVKKWVYPTLRQDGFEGSGTTLRRFTGDIVTVFNLQTGKSGSASCVNMGAHATFLPLSGGGRVEKWDRLMEYECEFRRRLAPNGRVDCWWPHGTEEGLEKNAKEIHDLYLSTGRGFYARFLDLGASLSSISPADLAKGNLKCYPGGSTTIRAALTLARVWEHLGQRRLAVEFAQLGLEKCGPAVALKNEFRRILAGQQNGPLDGSQPILSE